MALSPLILWRCLRVRSSLQPLSEALMWMLVGLPTWGRGPWSLTFWTLLLSVPLSADRPDCVDGRICFVFYSHLKNVKEVYITTALDRGAQAVRGQVS